MKIHTRAMILRVELTRGQKYAVYRAAGHEGWLIGSEHLHSTAFL